MLWRASIRHYRSLGAVRRKHRPETAAGNVSRKQQPETSAGNISRKHQPETSATLGGPPESKAAGFLTSLY
jgi:hypothetical protein